MRVWWAYIMCPQSSWHLVRIATKRWLNEFKLSPFKMSPYLCSAKLVGKSTSSPPDFQTFVRPWTASRRLVVKKAAADPSAATTSELLQDDEGGARGKAFCCASTVKEAAFIQNEY